MNKLLLLLLTITLLSCGGGSDIAGGSDMPNGIITGVVIASNGSKASGASVELSGIQLTPQGDSASWIQNTETNSEGEYEFTNVPENDYVLRATLNSGESALCSHITKKSEKLTVEPINTSKNIVLMGRLINPAAATRVFIPGTGVSAKVQSDGFFILNDIPRGDVALTFSASSTINVLPIQIDVEAERDTFFIRDTYFFVNGSIPYNYHSSKYNAYYTCVELYENQSQPAWYEGRDFSGVTYFDHVNDRELWYFPIEVIVSSASSYADITGIKALIDSQIANANKQFSDERFHGEILFAIKAVKTTANTLPPFNSTAFSMRLVYDETGAFKSTSEWIDAERTFILSGDDFVGNNMFSAEAQDKITYGLALSRGCENLFEYDVTPDENTINGFPHSRNELLLWGTGGNEWDPQSIEIINRNRADFSAEESFTIDDYPDSIVVQVLRNNQPVAGAEVTIYGLHRSDGNTDVSPRYQYHTDDQGYYKFTENPFLTGEQHSQFNNFLIEVTQDNATTNRWVPAFEIRSEFYRNGSHKAVIDINL